MGRADRRREQRESKKKEVKYYYTEQQLYDRAYEISNRLLESVGVEVRDSFKQAMRENRIGEARAEKILKRANELMKIKTGI